MSNPFDKYQNKNADEPRSEEFMKKMAERLAALEAGLEAEKATTKELRKQLEKEQKPEGTQLAGSAATDLKFDRLLTTIAKDNKAKREPWREVVELMIAQRANIDEAMDSNGEGTEWRKTAAGLVEMLRGGDLTVRELLLISTMLPGSNQADRNRALFFVSRKQYYSAWLRQHNLAWLEFTHTSLELDEGARVTAQHPFIPVFLERLHPDVPSMNNMIEQWVAASLGKITEQAEVSGGSVSHWLTFAERSARSARVRGGAPFLYHGEDANGVVATDAAPVAEMMAQYQYNQQQLQQQVERLGAQMSGLQVPAQPDVHAHQMQQQLGLITQLLQQIAPAPASTQLYKPPPRKWQSGHPPQQRQTRVRGAGAGNVIDDDDEGNE